MASDPGAPRTSRRRRLPLLAGAAALVVLGTVLLVVVLGGDGDGAGERVGVDGGDAVLRFPDSWRSLTRDQLRRAGGQAVAGIQRRDRAGLILVRAEGRRTASDAELTAELRRELDRRFDDFRFVNQRSIRTRAGEAFYFSYVRRRAGTAQSVTIARVGDRTYSLNTVVRGDRREAAREAGAIIRSFGPGE